MTSGFMEDFLPFESLGPYPYSWNQEPAEWGISDGGAIGEDSVIYNSAKRRLNAQSSRDEDPFVRGPSAQQLQMPNADALRLDAGDP